MRLTPILCFCNISLLHGTWIWKTDQQFQELQKLIHIWHINENDYIHFIVAQHHLLYNICVLYDNIWNNVAVVISLVYNSVCSDIWIWKADQRSHKLWKLILIRHIDEIDYVHLLVFVQNQPSIVSVHYVWIGKTDQQFNSYCWCPIYDYQRCRVQSLRIVGRWIRKDQFNIFYRSVHLSCFLKSFRYYKLRKKKY